MPKITTHEGPTNESDPPEPVPQPTAADVLRDRGKLGPYTDADQVEDTGSDTGPDRPDTDEVSDPDSPPDTEADTDEDDEVSDEEPEPDEPVRPSTSASKAEWVAYASAVTGETIASDDFTKAELVDLYGSD